MILTQTGLYIIIMFGFIFVLLLIVFLINRVRILSFLFPQNYNMVCVLESDNNVTIWTQKKNSDLRFEFNGGWYNMYDTTDQKVTLPNPDGSITTSLMPTKQATSIYRNGRLAQFFYIEGNEEPLDFRNNKISSNPQMRKQMSQVDLTKLWTMGSKVQSWLLYAIIGLLIGLILGSIAGGWGKIPKPVEAAKILMFYAGGLNAGKLKFRR